MQYLLLIHDDEATRSSLSDGERNAMFAEYGAFSQALREAGAYIDGNQLQPTATATTVRVRGGQQVVTDGPFAETKEALGGYYVIEAESIDEAIEWAAKVPSARFGTIELRPLVPARVSA